MKILKKMKLVPFDMKTDENNNLVNDKIILESSPYFKPITEINKSLDLILNSNQDDISKFHQYIQLFRNYLIFKNKYSSDEDNKLNTNKNLLKNPKTPPTFSNILFPPTTTQSIPSSSTLTPTNVNTPLTNTSIYKTPLSSKRKSKLIRKKKLSAQEKIKRLFENESSTDDETPNSWLPYQKPKKIKSIRRLKSAKKNK